MKLIFIISLICFFGLPFTAWWMIWIALGVCGWFANTYRESVGIGVAAASLAWGIKIGIGFFSGGSILIQRVADMMSLGSPILLIIPTLLLAVFLGGLSAISGYQLRKVFLHTPFTT